MKKKIELSKSELENLLRLLAISGFVISSGSVTDQGVAEAEALHETLQAVFTQAQQQGFEVFEKGDDVEMLFPKSDWLHESGTMELLHDFTHESAFGVMSQQLAMRDTLKKHHLTEFEEDKIDNEFVQDLMNTQHEYLKEFEENRFENLKLNKLRIIT